MIVEDGTIVAGADSLAGLVFADAYLEARGDAAWAALADEAKEAALVRATDHVEGTYRLRWLGYRVSPLQALSWPRADVYIADPGYTVGVSIVPVAVQRAVVELAARIGAGTDIAPDLSALEVIRKKVDIVEIEYKASGGRTQPVFPAVDRLLAPFLVTPASAGTIKLYRV